MLASLESYQGTVAGKACPAVMLRNSKGIEVLLSAWGARLVQIMVPDAQGRAQDVCLGYDNLSACLQGAAEMGAIVGRVANRTAKASFQVDGQTYKLAANDGPNHLHGGLGGIMRRVFELEEYSEQEALFSLELANGEDGYPGNMSLKIKYSLDNSGNLRLAMQAVCDQACPVNLCNHAYFNLGPTADVLGHQVQIFASQYTPTDQELIPSGEILTIEGTPLDFRKSHALGQDLELCESLWPSAKGYDHNYVLDKSAPENPAQAEEILAAKVFCPESGIRLQVFSTEPGLQLYSSNYLQSSSPAERRAFAPRAALCLETQHYPDSVHHSNFPSIILRPGQIFRSSTTFNFSTGENI